MRAKFRHPSGGMIALDVARIEAGLIFDRGGLYVEQGRR